MDSSISNKNYFLASDNKKNLDNSIDAKYLNSDLKENKPASSTLIYSWGRNKNYELGLGLNALQSYSLPQQIKALKNQEISQISSGGKHTVVLNTSGKLYVCGTQVIGLLGIDDKRYNDVKFFKKLEAVDHEMIVQVECAEFHTLCLTENGQVYSWGGTLHKKLGLGSSGGTPSRIVALSNKKVIQVACGDHHSCALTDIGELFSWGGGGVSYNKGQCGHGELKDIELPKRIEFFKNKKIVKVACGGYHTLALTNENKLFGFGQGNFGQCGQGEYEDTSIPKPVIFDKKYQIYENSNNEKKKSISEIVIIDIKCGGNHSVVLSNYGRVYTFGHNMNGQLGLNDTKNHATPALVKCLLKKNIVKINAGWSHTIASSDLGFIYGTGKNHYGQLGLDDTEDRKKFVLIKSISAYNVSQIATGGHHTWIVLDKNNPYKEDNEIPSPLESPINSPLRRKDSGSPGRSDDDKSKSKIKLQNDFLNYDFTQSINEKSRANLSKTKLNLDLLSNQMNESFQIQVAYTDLKMSHRFVRFTLSQKYKDTDTKDLSKMVSEFLQDDKNVQFFRLQNDLEANMNSFGINSFLKEMKNSFKIFESMKNPGNFSLCIVYDIIKNPDVKDLLQNLESNNNTEKERLNKRIYDVHLFNRDDILNNDLEKILSSWVLNFLDYFEGIYEGIPKFIELRPNTFLN